MCVRGGFRVSMTPCLGARIEVLLTVATPPNRVNFILGCNALRTLSAGQARPKCRGAHECTHVPAHRSNTHEWLYCFDILELHLPSEGQQTAEAFLLFEFAVFATGIRFDSCKPSWQQVEL